jgi:hypothetical protein
LDYASSDWDPIYPSNSCWVGSNFHCICTFKWLSWNHLQAL